MNKQNKQQPIEVIKNDNNLLDKKKHPIYIRTLNVFVSPIRGRYEKYYKEKKKHLVIDLVFVFLILILIVLNVIVLTKDFKLEEIQIKVNLQPKIGGEQDNQPVVIKDAKLNLVPQLVYHTGEGEQLGSGPWPPVVGQASTIRVILDLSSDSHAISNLRFSARLPQGVEWTNKFVVNLGQPIEFDNTSRKVIWGLDKLGVEGKAQLSFELRVIATESDLRQKIKLLEGMSLVGFDLVTGKNLSAVVNDLYSPEVVE